MDIASLGLELRSNGLAKGTNRLKDVEHQARRTEGAAAQLNRTIRNMAGGFLAMAGTTFGIAGLVRISDEYTSLTNLLRVVAGEQGNVNQMLEDLNGIAGRTRAPLEATARLYQRVSVAANELGASNEEVLRFTENVGLALAQQGGSAAAASGALLQLSQAMGAGVIRAEEFNSILEGAHPIAQAAARGLDAAGGSVAKLRGLIIEGKVTSEEFFRAILSQTDDLEAAFANTVPTVGGALSRVGDSMMLFIGALNESTGASDGLARAFLNMANALGDAADWVRENGDTIRTVMNTVVGSALIYGTGLMIQFGLSALTAGGQVTILTGALGLLKTAIISTGFGVLIVGAGYLLGKFFELSQAVGGFGNAMVYLKELGLEVWERLQLGGGALVEGYKAYTAAFVLLWREAFATVINLFARFSDDILNGMQNVFNSLGPAGYPMVLAIEAARDGVKSLVSESAEAANAAIEAQKELVAEHFKNAQQMAKDALAQLEMWQALNDVIDADRQKASGGASAAIPSTPVVPGTTGAANDNSDALKASQQTIASLQDEIDKLSLTDAAYRQLQVTKAWALAPTQEMADEILMLGQKRDLLLSQADAEERLKIAKGTLDDLRFEYELIGMTNVERAKAIVQRDLERQGVIEGTEAWNTYGEAILNAIDALETYGAQIEMFENMSRALGALSRGFGDLADAMGNSLGKQSAAYKAMFALQKAFSIASAIMAIRTAMAKAMAEGITIWERLANVAIVASSGASIISDIQSLAIGFREGGYTGNMGIGQVAGVVHGQEFVAHAEATRRWRPQLEAMNAGTYRPANDDGGTQVVNEITFINQAPGVRIEKMDENTFRIIAREEAAKAAPEAVAGAIREPNSSVSKALKENISAPRRRA